MGPVNTGNEVNLTCSVSGGNPLAALSWNCSGNVSEYTLGQTAVRSVVILVDKTDNNKICTCSASHPVTSYRPNAHVMLDIHCEQINNRKTPILLIFKTVIFAFVTEYKKLKI